MPNQAPAPDSRDQELPVSGEAALGLLGDVLADARKAGADAADAVLITSRALSVSVRLREPEKTERDESADLGLRVLVGKRQAMVSTTDFRPDALKECVERAIAMARNVPEDEFCGLADPDQLATSYPELDSCDESEPGPEELLDRARRTENAALESTDITNSEGADASFSRSSVALAASNGFAGRYEISRFGIGVAVLAGEGAGMERDYDFSSSVYQDDLDPPEEIGRSAASRVVKRLHPRKVKTAQVPIVLDPRVSAGMVGALAGAINGSSIARGTSFLKDKMGKQVLASGLNIIDDPHMHRGMRSKPFDAEGLANRRRALVEDGILQSWVMDLRSARQLGLESTGHASRGTAGAPSPSTTNLYLEAGKLDPMELISDIPAGLYITEMLGHGVNGITGDYSRGAVGFWIENGEIAYPVSEVTIAGNLKDMLMHMTPANDLVFRYGTNAPTLRIEGMTVAGN